MAWLAAGYQGSASILTRALAELCACLHQQGGSWSSLQFTPNVTAEGEGAMALFDSVETNRRQLCYMASGYLSQRVPELQVLDLPFTHADRKGLFQALDSAAGEVLRQAVLRQTGFRVLGFWDNGQRHITNALRPIRSPADARGMRIRTLDSALYRASLNAMGFDAVTCDVKELVPWIAQGVVQAQENPLTNYLGFELWRHHPHVSLTGHFWGALLLVCPATWYAALAPDQQLQLHAAASQVTAHQREWAAGEDERAVLRLQELGVACLMPEELDQAGFQRSVKSLRQHVLADLPADLVHFFGLTSIS
jgi:TRAP-type C4-dicarboxylate transport system substrate-binding protein